MDLGGQKAVVRGKAAVVVAILAVLIPTVIAGCISPSRRQLPPTSCSFGSDHFGCWIIDGFGLPAFRYTADEATDHAARWNDGTGTSTSFWHQLGNDRVVADAFNDGYVELWDGERQYRSGNFYDAAAQQFAGGFGTCGPAARPGARSIVTGQSGRATSGSSGWDITRSRSGRTGCRRPRRYSRRSEANRSSCLRWCSGTSPPGPRRCIISSTGA